jgi:hypothetical protein
VYHEAKQEARDLQVAQADVNRLLSMEEEQNRSEQEKSHAEDGQAPHH